MKVKSRSPPRLSKEEETPQGVQKHHLKDNLLKLLESYNKVWDIMTFSKTPLVETQKEKTRTRQVLTLSKGGRVGNSCFLSKS